jgi:NTE family protein
MIPYRIYLSGGGMCAMAHVGALLELSTQMNLRAIKEWMGVSAGALVAMCLSIGYTLEELSDFCVRFDFTTIKDTDSVPGWILHFGIDTGERLQRLVDACLRVKGLSSEITFKECYDRFGISLHILATDMNEACIKQFTHELTPDYKVSSAVRASMTFPYYFQPFICPTTGHYLIDGGVISNYPLFVLSNEEHARTLSILIQTTMEQKENLHEVELDQLFIRPLNLAIVGRSEIESKLYSIPCIKIRLGQINILDFSFDEETKDRIIQEGKTAVEEYWRQQKIHPRRKSI